MLRYVAAASTLKVLSLTPQTRKLYRALGNRFGGPLRRRETYLRAHISRGELFRQLTEEFGLTQGGERMLEIGTGWLHWHSIYHRLFNDAHMTTFDVWDCRQMHALKELFGDVDKKWAAEGQDDEQARETLKTVLAATSFEELYDKLGLEYFVEASGSLDRLPDASYDCAFSFHVLEHVPRDGAEPLVQTMHRLLKPGGYCIHQIGIDDHLTHYDAKESPKSYLRYSEGMWRHLFENELQYTNLLQMSDWLAMFERNGFEFCRKQPVFCDITGLSVHPRFKHYSEDDLRCTILTLVHRKPE